MLKRSAVGDAVGLWAFPGGKIEDGESAQSAAQRECKEEIGYLPGSLIGPVATSQSDEVHFTTFLHKAEDEFSPKLNDEHTAFAWVMPSEALGEHAAAYPMQPVSPMPEPPPPVSGV